MIDTLIEKISRMHNENAELRQLLINAQFYLDLARTECRTSDHVRFCLGALSEDIDKKLKKKES